MEEKKDDEDEGMEDEEVENQAEDAEDEDWHADAEADAEADADADADAEADGEDDVDPYTDEEHLHEEAAEEDWTLVRALLSTLALHVAVWCQVPYGVLSASSFQKDFTTFLQ